MNSTFLTISVPLGAILSGLLLTLLFFKGRGFLDIGKRQKEAEEMVLRAQKEAQELLNETNDRVQNLKKRSEEAANRTDDHLRSVKNSIAYREETLIKKEEKNKEIKIRLAVHEEDVHRFEELINKAGSDFLVRLAERSGQSAEKLKEEILDQYQRELEIEKEEKVKRIEERAKEDAPRIAKKTVVQCIQRLCSPTSVESRAVHVVVPKDFIKGKIVGRGACNILEFENQMPEVSIVFNDLPNTISLSCFNLVNRRIAQKAIEKLIKHRGDIDKGVITKSIQAAEKETNEELYEIGKKAITKMGFKDWDKEFVTIIGRLKYRTSYGQNIMKHSMEVGWITAMMASEIGLDTETSKVAGFLHDVGKAIDQDPNEKDAHDYITKDLMEKYGFSWEATHAAWTHHDSIPNETSEAFLVKAADAISAARPGARQESIHTYAERIHALEETAHSFEDIEKVFTMAAGREVRMQVNPEKLKDKDLAALAARVVEKIEENVTYPGKIKVNIVRRVVSSDTATTHRKR